MAGNEYRDIRIKTDQLPDGIRMEMIKKAEENPGICTVHIRICSEEAGTFSPLLLHVSVPSRGIHYRWTPKLHLIKALNLDWFEHLNLTNGFTGAPVECLISAGSQNCATVGISDTLHTVGLKSVPIEETAEYEIQIELFVDGDITGPEYSFDLRMDTRPVPYYDSLHDMALWWAAYPGNEPALVPTDAKEPMYSTWYSFHQNIREDALLEQCKLASELGMKTLLIDDGWQTEDNHRGYAYCGDWKPALSKLPDMAAFVKKVHELGMKVVPWYSVPFIGERSENFKRFQDMLIDPDARREWHVLDPRYPQVREFLIETYEHALCDWDLDGFKLDFVDEFVVTPFSGRENDERRDVASFTEAADILMKECMRRLKAIRPDVMLEFRQTYNGPLMRSFGNIIRAVDCPFDDVENRLRVTDIRLLAGDTAVHSDMLMWDMEDDVESAALQIIAVLFSVPQISMELQKLPETHLAMLRFYCELWRRYKDAFIEGSFQPHNPQCRYNVILGYGEDSLACTYHSRELIEVKHVRKNMLFVNGSGKNGILLSINAAPRAYKRTVRTCTGEIQVHDTVTAGSTGEESVILSFAVPVGGSVELVVS